MAQKINTIYIILIPILILGISLGYTTFPICLALLTLRLLVSDKHAAGFYLLMYGGIIGGITRTIYPFLPVYGLLLNFIGLILIRDKITSLFTSGSKAIRYLFLLYIIFAIFYFLGPQDDFAVTKFSNIIQHGIFTLIGYYAFCSYKNINNESILQIMFLSTLLCFSFVIQYYHFSPGNIFNYEWFRDQSYSYMASTGFEEGTMVSYQHIAMNMLYGLAIFLSSQKLNRNKSIAYVMFATQLILTSGCRQAILGLFLVLILRLTVFRSSSIKTNYSRIIGSLIIGTILIFISYQLLVFLNIEFINTTLKEGDVGRNAILLEGIQIFLEHPALGAGLGGYHQITGEGYPHNFIVEILCECGLLGTTLMIALLISSIKKANMSLRFTTQNQSYLLLILSALLVRILVSADLTVSIELFSGIFITLAVTGSMNKTAIENN